MGIAARPHPPLRDLVDLLAGLLAPGGDALQELVVATRDLRLQQRARVLAERPVEAQLPRQRRRPDAVDADADLAERLSRSG